MTTHKPPADAARVPDLLVEKLALGELHPNEAEAVREQLGDEADERLAALARDDEDILREYPPATVAAQVQRRLAQLDETPQRARPGWLLWAPVAVAAAAALVLWVGTGDRGDPVGDDDSPQIAQVEPSTVPDAKLLTPVLDGGLDDGKETILLKGDPVLMIDRIDGGRAHRLTDQAPVAAGDLLQVKYNAKGAAQGVVVSLDGSGVVTLHYPATEDADPRLDHGGAVPLPDSYELDDAPGFERFLFVTVDVTEPRLSVDTVMAAARTLAASQDSATGALDLPEGWRQQSILLPK